MARCPSTVISPRAIISAARFLERSSIREVIQALNLDTQDKDLEISVVKKWLSQLKTNITRLIASKDGGGPLLSPEEQENQEMQALIKTVKEKISVEQIRDTRLLDISAKDKDPELAAALANTLVDKFMEFNRRQRFGTDVIQAQ